MTFNNHAPLSCTYTLTRGRWSKQSCAWWPSAWWNGTHRWL